MVFRIVQLFEASARKDDAYKSDRETRRGLSACASTCRAQAVRFQPLLFRHLQLSSPDDVQQLATLVRTNCTIGEYVHSLMLMEDRGLCAHLLVILLSCRLPSLRSIALCAAAATNKYASLLELSPVLPSFSGLQTVTSLTLEDCRFRSFKGLARVISAFTKLASLHCYGLCWDSGPSVGAEGLVVPTGISSAGDTLMDIKVNNCPQYGLFLLLFGKSMN